MSRASHSEPTKKRPLPAVPECDFTFSPMAPMQRIPPPETPPSFNVPGKVAMTTGDPVKLESIRGIEPGRSIFDVLHGRSKLASGSIPSQVTMPSMASDQVDTDGVDLVSRNNQAMQQGSLPTGTAHAEDLSNGVKAHFETDRPQQAEVQLNECQEEHTKITAVASLSMALVLHSPVSSIPPKSEVISLPEVLRSSEPTEAWYSHRIFFTAVDGHTRLVDLTQTLYDVDVMEDDGGSDFDSIASPAKFSPANFESRRTLICNDTEVTSSSDETETGYDVEDLVELCRFDCAFVTRDSEIPTGEVTPATTNSFSDDEDVIDTCLQFPALEAAQNTTYDMPSGVVLLNTADLEQDLSVSLMEDEIDLSCGNVAEVSDKDQSGQADCDYVPSSPRPLTEVPFPDAPQDIQHCSGTEGDYGEECDLKETNIDTGTLYQVDSTYGPPSTSAKVESTDRVKNVTSSSPFSSDWASDLVRITLGTESLLTFLEHLCPSSELFPTKSVMVAAFLELVNLERSKHGERSLPQSYTASAVMASKIIPHTIFLGTTSLASLLSQFVFGDDGKTTIDEVYHVFKALSKEDLRLQIKATTGTMGALGRRLGRVPIL
jgi:hypothetical protein